MKSLTLLLCTYLGLISTLSTAQNNEPHFTLTPTLTPDGQTIIFSYESDLWKVPTAGGNAERITAMDGDEKNPSVSPDGKWLAFSSNQFGNDDVYIMPMTGGKIEQLTFHDGNDVVSSWSWDSKKIYFASNRLNSIATYWIDKNGGTPSRLFDHYFNTVHNVVEDPKSDDIYFNESWESNNFAHRKRYKGDYNPDIKSYNPKTKEFKKHTTYRGKDFGASFDRNGRLYFMSDEANGEYNLYRLENNAKTKLTNFSSSIMWPKVSANGEKVVFRKDYQLYVYDVASGKTTKPTIQVYINSTLNQEQSFKTNGNVTYFDVSPDEKKIAFISRGRLFISDIEGKFISSVNTDEQEAIQEVKWLKDNKTLLYSQSVKGYYNWFTINSDPSAKAKPTQLTKDQQNNREISLNSDRSQAVYLSGRNTMYLLDLKNFKRSAIVTDEFWGLYNTTPQFSPDDAYIVYNAYRNFETEIFTYHIASKTILNLTNTKVSESNPVWSPDGKYIYFASDRIQPGYPSGTTNAKIFQMALDRYDKPFKMDKVKSLFEEKEVAPKKDKKGKEKASEPKEEKITVSINPNGLMERLTRMSRMFGQQRSPSIITEGDETHILYLSNQNEGKSQLYKTTISPFKPNKIERVSDLQMLSYQLVQGTKKTYILVGGKISTLAIKANKLTGIDLNYTFSKTLAHEFEQMFYEAWAGMEENFYDENFHGQNWQKLRDRYAVYIPYVRNRSNLRLIFNDMLGELNTSHFGFNSQGKEEDLYYGTKSLATGILFDQQNPYLIDRIIPESPVDLKDKNLRKGDELIAVNGVKVNKKLNRESYFTTPSFMDEMSLTFKRNGTTFTVNIHPTSTRDIRNLLYDEWQDQNQKYVDEKSNNQIAYVHMKNMSFGELPKFKHDLVSSEADKKALILDLRYNTGGNVHDEVLNFLQQKTYLNWKYRGGKLTGQSNFNYGNKPIVLLINEQSLSDAEMTAAGFKALGLGTIVGTETYRWIIFTTSKGLVDGSSYRLPSWGCYTLDGKDLEIEGVKPDVYVPKDFKDRIEGNHPQLDKALEIILSKINN